MKILFLTPRGSRKNLGGVEGHVRILTGELVKRGHQVKELSLDEIDVLNKNRLPRAAGVGSPNDEFLSKGRALGYKFKAWRYLWKKRDLFRWADVIHVHDVFWWILPFIILPTAVMRICEFLRKKDKGNQKDKKIDGTFFKGTWRNLEDFRGRQRIKPVFITFHGWEGVCPPTRSAVWQKRLAQKLSQGTIGVGNFFKKWYGVKADKVVWGAINKFEIRNLKFEINKRKATIVFLGRMEKVNGVEVVVEALEKLANRQIDKYTNIQIDKLRQCVPRIIFVGDGSYRKQAEKFGKVTGMVKNPQKYLASADLVIASSYMSILEAAAIGKPIIAIGNNELKMDYLKTHPLGKWIRICRNSEELIREIGGIRGIRRELELARQWALKQTPIRLADVYEELWKKYSLSFRT